VTGCGLPSLAAERLVLIHALVLRFRGPIGSCERLMVCFQGRLRSGLTLRIEQNFAAITYVAIQASSICRRPFSLGVVFLLQFSQGSGSIFLWVEFILLPSSLRG
jgi:hypothetical protein